MNKKTTLILAGIVLVVIAVVLVVMNWPREDSQVVTIGAILPLTGDAAQYGKACQRGMEYALEQLKDKENSQLLRIIYEDSQAIPTTAVSSINKLISVDGVNLIIGDMFSSTTMAIAPIAQRKGVVLISPTASAQAVPQTGDHVFSIYPSDAYDGEFLGNSIRRLWPGFTRVAIVYAQAEAMVTCKDAFKKAVNDAGIVITSEDGIPQGTRDFSTVVTRIAGGQPEVVFCAMYLPETASVLREAARQGMTSQIIGISTCYDPQLFELAETNADGLVFSAPFFDVSSNDTMVREFVSGFEKRYGEKPDVWAAYGYDVIRIAAIGLDASADEPDTLHSAIAAITDFQGATGNTSFNSDGSVTKQLRLLKAEITSRSFVPVDFGAER